jgi:ATP-dependent Clp protease ATP-binding subunit ClpC
MVSRVREQVAEHELQLDVSDDAKDLLVDKGWDPTMGARPLRRAIQRYIEDPLADEVLKAGSMPAGATVQVERDAKGDEEDKPLKLKIVKPRKKPAAKKKDKPQPEKVGVAAAKDGDDSGDGDDASPDEPSDATKD